MRTGTPHQIVTLPDGRRLGFAEYGDPGGRPLLAFHGTPGARQMIRVIDRVARERRVRVIAPDRPGFGLSDFQPGRRLGDWPDDVSALADRLGLEQFAVAGVSGGGPYALACAWKIPARLEAVGVVSGMGPLQARNFYSHLSKGQVAGLLMVRHVPKLARLAAAGFGFGLRRTPDKVLATLMAASAPADRAILERPEVSAALLEAFAEALRAGSRGLAHELALFGQAWGFALEAITVRVELWHGESDLQVPVWLGRATAERLPRCRARMIPGAGHYWIFDHQDELLDTLFP